MFNFNLFIISLVVVVVLTVFTVIYQGVSDQNRENDLERRRKLFLQLTRGGEMPHRAIEQLNNLLASASIRVGEPNWLTKSTMRAFDTTVDQYRRVMVLYFRRWWEQLLSKELTVEEAVEGTAGTFCGEADKLVEFRLQHNISAEEIGVNESEAKRKHLKRCCEALEELLEHYPPVPNKDFDPQHLVTALRLHWNCCHEHDDNPPHHKWKQWEDAANTRLRQNSVVKNSSP